MPKLTRIDASASPTSIPIALSAVLGSTEPEAHAEPVETAKPARSRRIISASPSTPGKARWEVLGRRAVPTACSRAPGSSAAAASKRSRSAARWRPRSASSAAARSAATPSPTTAGTFSVEARRRRSWLPPTSSGTSSAPPRTHSAAAPSGPWNLWPPRVRKSTPRAPTSTGTLPTACTASHSTGTPRRRHSAATSATGCRVPTSLLASIRPASRVSASTAARKSVAATTPCASGATRTTSIPAASSSSAAARTDGCSKAEITTRPRKPARRPAPSRTALLASVPEAVNTTSGGTAPSKAATCARAASTASRAACPKRCSDDGLPCRSPSHGSMASRTRGSSGVVALWSR